MLISSKGRYALRIMLDLAQYYAEDGIFISLKTVSQRQEISAKYLEMIVGILNRAGFVESLRGKNGGYRLSRPPAEYTVGSILQLTEGGLVPVNCLDCQGDVGCNRSDHCNSLPLWSDLNKLVNDYLEGITLDELLKNPQNTSFLPPPETSL